MKLLTYNIRHGGVGRAEPIAEVVARASPDIVILQEATVPAVVSELGRRLSMQADCGARQSLGFLSRIPIARYAWHHPRISRHAFLEVQPEGTEFRIFGLHLSAVHSAWTEHRRTMELGALLRAIAAHQHGFHVLAGDFNTLAPGEELDLRRLPPRLRPLVWLSGGRIKWKTIHTIVEAGYIDAFRACHPADPGMTMPSWDPHVRLDYVFVPQAYRDRIAAIDVVRDPRASSASDHLPVVADLTIR